MQLFVQSDMAGIAKRLLRAALPDQLEGALQWDSKLELAVPKIWGS